MPIVIINLFLNIKQTTTKIIKSLILDSGEEPSSTTLQFRFSLCLP